MKIIKYFSLFIILCLLLVGASFASNDTTTISNEKITTLDNTHVVSNNTCISTKDNKIQKTNEYNKIDKITLKNQIKHMMKLILLKQIQQNKIISTLNKLL